MNPVGCFVLGVRALRKRNTLQNTLGLLRYLTAVLFVAASLLLLCAEWEALPYHINKLHDEFSELSDPQNQRSSSENFWLRDYLEWHALNRHSAKRQVIFNTVKAGLGDNIRGMLRVYAFAVLTKRLFLVNWTRPVPLAQVIDAQTQSSFGYNPDRDAPNTSLGDRVVYFHYHQCRDRIMYDLLKSNLHTVAVATGHPALTNQLIARLRTEHWRGVQIPLLTLPVQRKVVHTLLAPSADLLVMHQKLKERFEICAPNVKYSCVDFNQFADTATPRQYIGVHARLGVGTGESRSSRFSKFKGKEDIVARCFAGHVKNIAKRSGEQTAKVYVASDTSTFRASFGKYLRDVLARSEVFYTDSSTVHYAKISNSQARKQVMELHMEMRLLGNASHIISFRSGFSEAAFWMGDALSHTVITPESCGIFETKQKRKRRHPCYRA